MPSSLVAACITFVAMVMMLAPMTSAQESCPTCRSADSILKHCNTSIHLDTWSSPTVYQPDDAQAPCACNTNYYQLMENCLSCQTSDTAKYSVKPLADYKLVCTSQHQEWKEIYIPPKPSTSTTIAPTSTPEPTNADMGSGAHTGLSSGAIAGIIVSVIALIVALVVAGYVYQRRKRDLQRQQEEDELYKYNSQARSSYMEVPLPHNLRVMNPDADEDDVPKPTYNKSHEAQHTTSSSPGWRRGSFDDD
ncbi:hypothetical protein BGZ94_003296 [Podila epigama]|nr:hypothetical protein BGZ94_003296 [Podila epigama]